MNKIITASEESFGLPSNKFSINGHGIDTNFFKKNPDVQAEPNSILYLGRISPIKNILYLVGGAKILDRRGLDFKLSIIGLPSGKSHFQYEHEMRKSAADSAQKGTVKFFPKVEYRAIPKTYNCHEVYLNLTPTGSFDKVILEAMAGET